MTKIKRYIISLGCVCGYTYMYMNMYDSIFKIKILLKYDIGTETLGLFWFYLFSVFFSAIFSGLSL